MREEFQILEGSCLDVLKGMESESVQTCITSPPYYGLRSYGTEPQVWGNHNGCSHSFGSSIPFAKQDNRTAEQKAAQGANVGSNINFNEKTTTATSGNFCLSCNAWRGELGLEPTFQLFISHLIEIFAEVKRVLKKDGTCWVNLGDSHAGSGSGGGGNRKGNENGQHDIFKGAHRPTDLPQSVRRKSLMNIPARFAIAMTDELKMIQRNHLIWYKRACMPSSAKDRFTVDFESIFFFSKEPRYKFNQQLENFSDERMGNPGKYTSKYVVESGRNDHGIIKNGGVWNADGSIEGRNKRCVWDVPFEPSGDEHYAAYPTKLVEPMILAGTDEGDTVLDIFNGTGTTGITALRNRRKYIGIELQPKYVEITNRRFRDLQVGLFA